MARIKGTSGDDFLVGTRRRDRIDGDAGNDVLIGGEGADEMRGGAGDDRLVGGSDDLLIDGGQGSDIGELDFSNAINAVTFHVAENLVGAVAIGRTRIASLEAVRLSTGSGNDLLTGGSLADTFTAGAGTDFVNGGFGDDVIAGEAGDDLLVGEAGDDRIDGGDGNDQLYGGFGADVIDGGAGDDHIESGRAGNDGAADGIDGGAGNDRIFDAGFGDARVDGGDGIDFAELDFTQVTTDIAFAISANLADGVLVEGTEIRGIEQVEFAGGEGNDLIAGGDLADTLRGGAGNDHLDGGAGDDALDGGSGNDAVGGGLGDDNLSGGLGDDQLSDLFGRNAMDGGGGTDTAVVSRAAATADIIFSLGDPSVVQTLDDGSTLVNIERVILTTGSGNDTLVGASLADTFEAGAGNDFVNGGFGDDVILGEGGGDLLVGEAGDDRIDGGDGNDHIYGGFGADAIDGGAGDDYIDSGRGNGDNGANDAIDGGAGNDTAVFSGKRADYGVELLDDGGVRLTDLRTGSPDGADLVWNVETFRFADGPVTLDELLTPANRAPVAVADAYVIGEDAAAILPVLANDSDPDAGDVVTLVAVDAAGALGQVAINPDGTVSYSPGAAFRSLAAGTTATDSFTYTIRDAAGLESTAAVTLTITGANDAPDAVGESYSVASTGVAILGDLLANDSDIDQGDGVALGAVEAVSAKGASVTIDSEGRAVYDPGDIFADLPAGHTATDSFSYTVVDGHGAASTATVTVTINGGSATDPRLDAAVYVEEDQTTDNFWAQLFDTAAFVFGPEVEIVSVGTTQTKGTLLFDPGQQTINFAADDPSFDALRGEQEGLTSFVYTVRDADGALHRGAVEVHVQGVNDGGVAIADSAAVSKGQMLDLWAGLLANDLDAEGDSLSITGIDTGGTLGRVEFDASSQTLRYFADTAVLEELGAGETLVDQFTYTIKDSYSSAPTSTATVFVTVTGTGETSMSFELFGPAEQRAGVSPAAFDISGRSSWDAMADPFLSGGQEALQLAMSATQIA